MKLSEIVRTLERIAPPEYACPGDKIGLQVGDMGQEIRRILVTVDATPRVIGEAIRMQADLIIAHHPLIWAPMTTLRLDVYPQSLVYQLVNANIALYAMHTNLDCADGGINDVLAERLGVIDTQVLEPVHTRNMFKLAVFVPHDSLDKVRSAIFDVYPGDIGNYNHCSFASPGVGTFKPLPGAEPFIGKVGEMETTAESKLEVLVPEDCLHDVIAAMISEHPYEEVAYDVHPLWNKGKVHGIGRIGKLPEPMTFDAFIGMAQNVLSVEDIRISGAPGAMIETAALVGGSGGDTVELAHRMGADVLLTGDVRHHEFLHAEALGLNIIDATHFATERPGMIEIAPRLHDLLSTENVTVEYVDDVILGGSGE